MSGHPHAVLFVNTPTYLGGAEMSLLALMQGLDPGRYSPRVLTSGRGPFSDAVHAAGISLSSREFAWFSKRRPWRYMMSIHSLVRTIAQNQVSLVHTNCDHSLDYVRRATAIARVPYVCHVRDFVRAWFEPAKVQALKRAARVIANSHAIARACTDSGLEPQCVATIYNPVDVDAFRSVPPAARDHLRSDLGIPREALVVAIVGQIQPIKGQAEFVEAALALAGRLPSLHFMVVGAPAPAAINEAFLAGLHARVATSPHGRRFHFVGFRSEVPSVLRAVDILAVASWQEPFGRVAVEAMASGCAVVATNAGGLPEIITDGVDGLLVPPKDVAALSAALYRLATQPELRGRLTEAACHSAERFTIDAHVQCVQALYDDVLANARAGARADDDRRLPIIV